MRCMHLLVSDLDAGELVVIDTAARSVIKRLPLGRMPERVLIPPDGSVAYVAVNGDHFVAAIDLKTWSATSEYNVSSTHYGEATTDTQGRFSIARVPVGQKYLYVVGPGRPFWVTGVTPFVSVAGQETIAADTYLCKGFDPIGPRSGESVTTDRPELRWDPYPDAVDYAVRILRKGQNTAAFSRGGAQTPSVPAAEPIGRLNSRVDPDHAVYGVPLGTAIAQFVGAHGRPTGELHLSPVDTVLVYGRSHAFYFESERLVGGFLRSGGYVLDFRLTDRLIGTTPFDMLGWQLPNGVESGMTLTTIRKMLGDTLLGCAASGPGFPRCYFTTERSRVEFDFVPRPSLGVSGDDSMVAMGIITRANK